MPTLGFPAIEATLAAATAHYQAGQLAEAERLCVETLGTQGASPAGWYLLGLVRLKGGRVEEAAAAFRQSVARNADSWPGINLAAAALFDLGQIDDAVAAYRRSIALEPTFAGTHHQLATALLEVERLDEAIAHFSESVRLQPSLAQAHKSLGDALRVVGRLDEAIACYDRALAADPYFAEAGSGRLFALQRHPDTDSAALLEEHRRWNERHARPLASLARPHQNVADPERRLRVGYVSPHALPNPVARFLWPLLAHHDRSRFHVVWYAGLPMPDEGLLRPHVDAWKPIVGVPDEQVAALVRADEIDILVDLSMHVGGNRLLVFARKPAPVQVTYLAYCSTTGMEAMDYRITDPVLDPPGQGDDLYAERSIRLPETYWCYPPNDDAPEPGPPPSILSGVVTFGCLNAFSKLTSPTVALWARLLVRVAGSRLLLHAHEGSHRQALVARMAELGVEPGRIDFGGLIPMQDYLARYRRIDVALDPFPYGGGTTTCDALWMGVPVITLPGRTAVGRATASILSNVGEPEWVASNPDEYLEKAAALAGDPRRLIEIRATLRERMRRSPLMNAPAFARNMEAAYRAMWRSWCERRS